MFLDGALKRIAFGSSTPWGEAAALHVNIPAPLRDRLTLGACSNLCFALFLFLLYLRPGISQSYGAVKYEFLFGAFRIDAEIA